MAFGDDLRSARKAAGFSLARLARAAAVSESLLGKAERGQRSLRRGVVTSIDRELRAGGRLLATWENESNNLLPSWARELAESEANASALSTFSPLTIPGVLQSAQYAEALIAAGRPGKDPRPVVASRLKRLDALQGKDVHAITSEAALRWVVGGAQVMRGQLEHLLNLDTVRLQVLTLQCQTEAWGVGAFSIRHFESQAPAVYVDSAAGGRLVAEPERVSRLQRLWAEMSAHALSPPDSADFIRRIRDAF